LPTARIDSWSRRRDKPFASSDPNAVMEQVRNHLLENLSIVQKRTGGTQPFRIGDVFATFYAHLNKAAAYSNKMAPLHDANRLLNDKRVVQSIRKGFVHGDDRIADMKNALRHYQGEGVVAESSISRGIQKFLRNAQVAKIGLKGQIILYQRISYFNALTEMDAKWLVIGAKTSPEIAADTEARIRKTSPLLRARFDSSGHQVMSPIHAGGSMQRFYGKPTSTREAVSVGLIHKSDKGVIGGIWRGYKAMLKSQGLTGNKLDEAASRLTEQNVNRTQPTWDTLTMSQLALATKDNPVLKIFGLMFSSQRSKNMQIVVRGTIRYKRGPPTKEAKVELVKAWAIPTIVNAISLVAIAAAYKGGIKRLWKFFGVGKYEEPTDPADAWLYTSQQVLGRLLGTWLVVGDAADSASRSAIRGLLREPTVFDSSQTNILTGTKQRAEDAVEGLARGISERAAGEYEKGNRDIIKGIDAALSVIATPAGFPYDGPRQLADPLVKELTEKPTN